MKYGQVETEKLYFSSNEVAKQVGVSVKVLHSWEKKYPELKPKINGAGKRVYRLNDIEVIKKIIKEQSKESIFGDLEINELKPQVIKEKVLKIKNKESLLKIRDNLQNALDKIKR